jgi:hypothetical protein
VMVIGGEVQRHRPSDGGRRSQSEQRAHGQGSLQGTPHEGEYPP